MSDQSEFEDAFQKLMIMQLMQKNTLSEMAAALGEQEDKKISTEEMKALIRKHFKNASYRVATIFKAAGSLSLGPAMEDHSTSSKLKNFKKFRKRTDGTLSISVEVAAGLAKSLNKDMWIYAGNSYMNLVWNIVDRESKALSYIENVGKFVYRVTPTLDFFKYEVRGRPVYNE